MTRVAAAGEEILRGRVEADAPAPGARPPAVRALPRERLTGLLAGPGDRRVLLVVAPAGSGKTTLLAQLAADRDGPVVWYRAGSSDASSGSFLSRLARSFAAATGSAPADWATTEDATRAIEAWDDSSPLLLVDDFHLLLGSEAEAALERLIVDAPALRLVIASRSLPSFNLSRLRVSGALLEVGPDDLRFRSWEVEQLFRDVYAEPLPPDDLALLTRNTSGWAAALQLFHLATRGKHAMERRRTLATLSGRSRLMREYLARNIIDELPSDIRDFMVGTSVLGRLTGPLCDALLGRTGSRRILEQLSRLQLFTQAVGEDDEYCYHDVLRSHLEAVLVEEVGEAEARARYRRAAALLEGAGALPEAFRAFCRAEEWKAADGLLGRQGEQLVAGSAAWIDVAPPAGSWSDPWLSLAEARHHRAAGRFRAAIAAYQEAERGFGSALTGDVARRERSTLACWVDPAAKPSSDWLGLVRQATVAEPLAVRQLAARELSAPQRSLAGGLAALLAGRLSDAIALLGAAAQDPEASPGLVVGALAGGAVARLLSGDPEGSKAAELAAEDAERHQLLWLARLSRASLVLNGAGGAWPESAFARLAFERHDDPWGSALTTLMEGWAALAAGRDPIGGLRKAADEFGRLGAGVLETWARAALALALARAEDPAARSAAVQAETAARSLGVPGAQAVAYSALAEADAARSPEHRERASALRRESSLAVPGAPEAEPAARASDPAAERPPPVVVRCFGGLEMIVHGRPVDLSALKPRARQLLRLLVLHTGSPVHREVLVEALWPDADPAAATRCLHVAVSSLRHVLEPDPARGASSLVVRDGEAYRLALTSDACVDLVEFDRALERGRAARAIGDLQGGIAGCQAAVALHRAELLPEDGPAEWLVRERERRAAEACEAAHAAAEMLLELGDPEGAAATCERGLAIDRYRDDLWRLRATAHERAGDLAAALQARREYGAVLGELGLVETAGRRTGAGAGGVLT